MHTSHQVLGFVLLEDVPFEQLLTRLSEAFQISLPYEDYKGRYIAKAYLSGYHLEVEDRVDRLSELLCDEYHVLNIRIDSNEYFNCAFEQHIKQILKKGEIRWQRYVWAPYPLPEPCLESDDDTESNKDIL
ncbi:hypothetical protein AR543_11720 [Paenibacillus bovis]|uniref:Uncharacterized protein n=2 Tax=Paenibacillus bovis TaxID=1616788 RepID=A0A172ZG45_9BACL|nr:hypothetical protein AR543_11720 [Paenibacillus bovis]